MNKTLKRVILSAVIIVVGTAAFFLLTNRYNSRNISPAMYLAQSVPGTKLDMDTLSSDQLIIIDKVRAKTAQYGGSDEKGKIVTEIWQIFNEANHYKVVLTAPKTKIFGDKSPVYYDIYDGEIIGNVSKSGYGSAIGENIFTSRAQDKFIKNCYSQINSQNELSGHPPFSMGEEKIIDDKTRQFTFKDRSQCTCLAIGCCDDFKPVTTEYNFICHLNLDSSVTLELMPVKNY